MRSRRDVFGHSLLLGERGPDGRHFFSSEIWPWNPLDELKQAYLTIDEEHDARA